jgi:transcriptional regulator with XRE-family HTH domain
VETVIRERMVFQEDLGSAIIKEEEKLTLERIAERAGDINSNIFEEMREYMDYENIKSGSKFAMTWMRNAIQDLYDIAEELNVEEKYFRDSKRIVTKRWMKKPGEMYLFNYNPREKSKLDYYDTFPLIFYIHEVEDGFLGMNLHYLPIKLREVLFVNMLAYATDDIDTDSETTRLRLTYDLLNKTSKLRYFRPCVKRYKYNSIDSRLLRIPSIDWITAIYLPIERFAKKKREVVWKESRHAIATRVKD